MADIRVSKSPKLYMQRRSPSTEVTRRSDGPRLAPLLNTARFAASGAPLPSVSAVIAEDVSPSDAGRTELWPAGDVLISRE